MRRQALGLSIWLLLLGLPDCGGSKFLPGGELDVGGNWSGYEEITGAEPSGNCYADMLALSRGLRGNDRVTIDQVDTAVTVRVVAKDQSYDDTYQGTVDSSSLTASMTAGFRMVETACRNGLRIDVLGVNGVMQVHGGSGELSGQLTEQFDVTNHETGAPLGRVTVSLKTSFSR